MALANYLDGMSQQACWPFRGVSIGVWNVGRYWEVSVLLDTVWK